MLDFGLFKNHNWGLKILVSIFEKEKKNIKQLQRNKGPENPPSQAGPAKGQGSSPAGPRLAPIGLPGRTTPSLHTLP